MNAARTPRQWQTGATLVVGLILLLVLTVVGVSGMNTATMEVTMAGNTQFQNDAFQMAEDGIDTVLAQRKFSTGGITTLARRADVDYDRQAVTRFVTTTPIPDAASAWACRRARCRLSTSTSCRWAKGRGTRARPTRRASIRQDRADRNRRDRGVDMLRTGFVLVVALAALQAHAQRTLQLIESSFELRLANTSLPAGAVGDMSFKTCDKCSQMSRVLTADHSILRRNATRHGREFHDHGGRDPQGGEHEPTLDARAARRHQDSEREPRVHRARAPIAYESLQQRLAWGGVGILSALVATAPASADDTELFVGASNAVNTAQTEHPVHHDDSGSMADLVSTQPNYDPRQTYSGTCGNGQVYYSTTGSAPDCSTPNFSTRARSSARPGSTRWRPRASTGPDTLAQYDDTSTARSWVKLVSSQKDQVVECKGRLWRARRRQPRRERLPD